MKILGDLPLPYLVFAYQLTAVVNVTLQLINVTVLDNCKSADISGVNWDVCGGKSAHLFWISTLAFVGELYWQTAKLSILGVEFRFWHKAPHNCFFAQSCFRRSVNSCWKCDHAVYVNVVNWNVCGSMSVHVFLHSNPVFVSLGEGYEMCKLNFLMRYVNFHSISKYALEIMSEQTRRGWKNVQIASIWARKSHLKGLWQRLWDRKSKLPRPKWSEEWFSPVPISHCWT